LYPATFFSTLQIVGIKMGGKVSTSANYGAQGTQGHLSPDMVVILVVILALCWYFFSDYGSEQTRPRTRQHVERQAGYRQRTLPRTRKDAERQIGYRPSVRQDEKACELLEDQVYVFKYANKAHSDLFREDRRGIPKLDLHELTVREALRCTRDFIRRYTPDPREPVRVVNIVTGRGVHSEENIPRVKNAIIKELEGRTNIRFDECCKGGMLRLHISCASRNVVLYSQEESCAVM